MKPMYSVIFKCDGGWHFWEDEKTKETLKFSTVNAAIKDFFGGWPSKDQPFLVVKIVPWDAVESPCP